MFEEDLGSMSDRSSDEELCQQLQDAGLMILDRKRRKQSFNDVKKKRLEIDDNLRLETEEIVIESLPFVEKVSEKCINLQQPTFHELQQPLPDDLQHTSPNNLQHTPPDNLQQPPLHELQQSPLYDVQQPVIDTYTLPALKESISDPITLQTKSGLEYVTISSNTINQPLVSNIEIRHSNIEETRAVVASSQSTSPKVVIISDVPYHGDLSINKKRQNKATKEPSKYQRNANKEKRMKGESYLGYRRDRKAKGNEKFKVKQDVLKPARFMEPPCNSSFCEKSKLRSCETITEKQRNHLFTTFWKTMNWEQRRSFICSHIIRLQKKTTKNPESNRNESRAYYFTIDNTRHQVCKKMFLATLGVKDWFIRYWLNKTDCAMPPDSVTSTKNRRAPLKTEGHEYLKKFLADLPKMPSHYCRASTSREYLEPVFQNMTQLYNKYKENCEFESQQLISRRLFDEIFLKLNLSIFHPKKDQCDVCCSHKTGNIMDDDYAKHLAKKDRARKEKDIDKGKAQSGACHVFTQDVESVKLAPYLQASAIYYKTKLCVHNFTLYNIATKEVMCYWFDETNSTLEASVFASCLVDQLEIILSQKLLPIIIFSDGCCAQNRNATLSNALLRLSIEKNIVITQKYLEKGHTQMECDSVHSAIECKLKGKEIYLPNQYVAITKTARKDPMPYEARLLEYTFFTDFSKDLIYKSIRPGRKVNDAVVTDLRVIEYRPNGTIWFKINYDDELKPLPHRPSTIDSIRSIKNFPKLYKSRIPISKRKFQDLQDLKSVLPSSCHSFYDELPYVN